MTNVCGTGGWSGPKPGDPDNNSVLTATPAFGGIDVSWSMPTTNSFAVSQVLIYRGLLPTFNGAIQIAVSGGNQYYDKVNGQYEYYYWIRIVSINGTEGELIGPASAVARPLIGDLIEQLTGQIDSGSLAQSLKDDLSKISILRADLLNEITARENSNVTLAQALTDVDAGVAEALTFVSQEISTRTSNDAALAEALNLTAVTLGNDFALATTALTTSIDAVTGTVGAMYTAKVNVNGLIGGFGLANDGATVEAGFDVDRFWVGKSSTNAAWEINTAYALNTVVTGLGYNWKCLLAHTSSQSIGLPAAVVPSNTYWTRLTKTLVKPFIIENDEVFIDQAVINKLTFKKLTNEAGTFIVNSEGQLSAAYINTSGMSIKNSAGTILLDAGNGYFSGKLSAGVVDFASSVGVTLPPFTAPGSYPLTVPTGNTAMRVLLVGGGGGGGAGNLQNFAPAGGGGGSGGIYEYTFTGLTEGAQYTLVVGNGGAGGLMHPSGSYGNNRYGSPGGAGGSTYVDGLPGAVATGGGGGGGGGQDSGGVGGVGGAAGLPSGGATAEGTFGTVGDVGGVGGYSVYGTGGEAGVYFGFNNNMLGGAAGGGGGGGGTHVPYWNTDIRGGAGAAGKAIIEYFDPAGVVLRKEMNQLKTELRATGLELT